MNSRNMFCLLGLVLSCSFVSADSMDASGGPAIGLQASTLGFGPVVTYSLSDWLALRGDVGWLALSGYDISSGETEYKLDVDYLTGGLLVDLYPFGGPLRITGGARMGSNSFDIQATVSDAWKVGDGTYPVDALQSVSGSVDFDRSVVPYAGIGFGNPARADHFLAMLDVGVLFQRTEVTLSATGPVAAQPEFQQNLAKEQADLQDELDKFEFYPVVTLVLGYRF